MLHPSPCKEAFPGARAPCRTTMDLLTSHGSFFLRDGPQPLIAIASTDPLRSTIAPVRSHGVSPDAFLVYPSNLHARVTFAFWTSLPFASLSAWRALVLAIMGEEPMTSCPSGHDFAIPSSRLPLAGTNLGNRYRVRRQIRPLGLSPKYRDMPVAQSEQHVARTCCPQRR